MNLSDFMHKLYLARDRVGEQLHQFKIDCVLLELFPDVTQDMDVLDAYKLIPLDILVCIQEQLSSHLHCLCKAWEDLEDLCCEFHKSVKAHQA